MPFLAPKAALDMVSAGLIGSGGLQLSQAISNAFGLHIITPGLATATLTGISGPGIVSSVGPLFGYEPASFSSTLTATMASNGLTGTSLPTTCLAIATGISLNLPMMLATGISPMVSTGGGVGKIVAMNPPALYGLLMSQASMLGMTGTELPRFMNALATGICTYLNAVAMIPVASVGAPVPPPPTGPLPMVGPATLQLV